MTAVLDSARSEWVKRRRRGYLASAVLGPPVAAALFSVLSVVTAQDATTTSAPGAPQAGVDLASLAAADGMVVGVVQAATLLGVLALCAAAASAAAEHSTGVLRVLLVRQPQRLSLLAGKTAVLAAVAAAVGVLSTLVGALAATAAAAVRGLDTSAWSTADGVSALLSTAADLGLACAGYAALGVAVGMLLRSPAAAVGAAAAWLLPVETLLAAAVGDPAELLPGRLLASVAGGGGQLGAAVALLGSAAWVGLALALAGQQLSRRDVTS